MSTTISVKFTEQDEEKDRVKIEVYVEKFSPSEAELTIAKAFHTAVIDCIDDCVKRVSVLKEEQKTQETEVKSDDKPLIITPDSN